jgi:shikimate kinase
VTAKHIVLVGLMGAGKTTVGGAVAQRLRRPFVDTDDLVEATSGRSVVDIFATGGEPEFRELERNAVADACAAPTPSVIACGGGAVLDPESRRRLRAAGFVVWLQAPAAVLAERAGRGGSRPLLARGGGAQATLERLASVREAAYESTADITVDTEGRTVDEVAGAVAAALPRSE